MLLLAKHRSELICFSTGFALFLILWGLVVDGIKLEGLARTVLGAIAGLGSLGALLGFMLMADRSWRMGKLDESKRKHGWLGFLGFLGFLGMNAFRYHDPTSLCWFCLFSLFWQFGYFESRLRHLCNLGLLGVLLPTLYVIGLLDV